MEDEISLRKYIDVLLRQWKLIVTITVIAIFVAGLVSFLSPSVYEAKASVLITTTMSPQIVFEPEYMTFSEHGTASQREALIALVKSNAVATQVIEQLGDKLEPGERRAGSILDKVRVRTYGDLIEISVKSTDPHQAVAIADAWAESYKSYISGLYGGSPQSSEELQVQADAARKDYEQKQKVWEDFVGSNRIDELNRQIVDKELLCALKSLREQIEAGSSSSASAAANSLAFVLLQARAFTAQSTTVQLVTVQPAVPQVSLGLDPGLNTSLDDVDALISTLEARSGGTQGQSISELRQEILQVKAELEQERAKQRELENSRDTIWEAYIIVAGKVVEAEVASRAQGAVVQIAEVAIVPESPVAPRRGMNISIALVIGLVVGILSAFGVEYYKKPEEKPKVKKEE